MNNPWIAIATPEKECNVRLVSTDYKYPFYWGKDSRGRYLFIADFADSIPIETADLPSFIGLQVAVAKAHSCTRIIILLNESDKWEIFKSLCVDLIASCENASTNAEAAALILRRLVLWRDLLKKETKHLLSPEAIKGLIGELLFLRENLAPVFGWDNAISFWKGPQNSPQDFAVNDTAVEIKTQAGSSKPYVQISSLEQLDPQLPTLYLVVYTLATSEAGDSLAFTLNSLVTEIKDSLKAQGNEMARDLFDSLIFQTGYESCDSYDRPFFRDVAVRTFKVVDGFPRITVKDVPDGITKTTYQISLDSCAKFEQPLSLKEE